MVSFSVLAFAAFAAVTEATFHGHMAERHLRMRAASGNFTKIAYPTAIGTGSSHTFVTAPTTTTAPVTVSGPSGYHGTTIDIATETDTKFLTLTYTLGNGNKVTTLVTKYETNTKTITHVKATVTVSPIIESTPSVSSVPTSSTIAPLAVPFPTSPSDQHSTHTTTSYVYGSSSGTLTVAAASSAPACPSVETVYVPSYITVYNTVTAAPPAAHAFSKSSHQNSTSTRTTTVVVQKTMTLTTTLSTSRPLSSAY